MSSPKYDRKKEAELRSLVNAALEGTADMDELRQLGQLLEENPGFVPRYADQLMIDTHLSWDTLGAPAPNGVDDQHESARVPQAAGAKLWGRVFAVAASLLLFAYCFNTGAPAEKDTDALAQITDLISHTSTVLKEGENLAAGVFQLSDGESATLAFCSGPQLYCEGPCKIDLLSPMLVSLEYGKVTADVPPPAIGFTVLTKRLQVTDLGTRFGVNVDKNENVDVVVFDGEVNLSDRQGKVELPEGLFAGEALSVNQSDHFERLVSIGHDSASKAWTSNWQTDTNLRRSVFSKVTDNLAIDSEPSFYGIVPRGLTEDTRAYSDRVHEWNSLPGQPLPAWLRGADLIRRFNSRKYDHASQLEVTVKVSTECVLYVLWDRRCKTPPWLEAKFMHTNFVLGMDEGPYKDGVDTLAVGPGKSIDTTYEVWATRLRPDEALKLGVLGNEDLAEHKNLYGIAAKPLDRISPEYFPLLFSSNEE